MTWIQDSNPAGNAYLSAFLASIPLLFLFWALTSKRIKGHWAALGTLLLAVLVAVAGYGMPATLSLLAALDGALFGLWPISWIIIHALFIYNLSVKTGQFEIIKNSLAAITDDRRMQALLVAFSFGAFIEGCAGFGAPVAITAAILIGLGFRPIYAAGICLLSNTAPVAFGSIGIPILVASQVSGIDALAISQMAGRTLPFISILIPFYIVILVSGWKKGLEVWPAALVCGASFALTQGLVANFMGPMLPDILSSVASIFCLTLFLRVWHPRKSWTFDHEAGAAGKAKLAYTRGQIFRAWAPYVVLTVLVAAWGVKPVKAVLDHFSLINIPIPGLHEAVIRDGQPMPAVYPFNLLSAAGTAVFFAGLVSIVLMGASLSTALRVFLTTIRSVRWPLVTISAILGFAYVMNFAGMAGALGGLFANTGVLFPFFSAFLGWLGVFMTGSDTSANALFGKLQEVTATKVGVDPVITVAANSVGGVCGKMISPQSLAVATAAVGLVGHESEIFRFTIKHSLILTTLVGIMACLQAYVFTWMVPVYQKSAAAAAAGQAGSSASGLACLAATAGTVILITAMSRMIGKSARP